MDAWYYTKEQRAARFAKKMDAEWHRRYVVRDQWRLSSGLWQTFECEERETGRRFLVNDPY